MTSTAVTTIKTYRPLTDASDLVGTILEHSDKDLTISLPFRIYEDVAAVRVPARLRKIKLSSGGTPIISDLQRAADRVVQSMSCYRESRTPENVFLVKESIGVYIRNVHKHLAWRFQDIINVRDSANTSSAFLIGVPAIRHDAFVDGVLSDLMPWQVALNPSLARKMGVAAGQKLQLCRFPETRTMVVEAVIDDTIGRHCVGIPIGQPNLAAMLGGDCDGDCYGMRAFHTPECQSELEAVFEKQWAHCAEPVLSDIVHTWRDESPSGKSDHAIAASKFMQKITVGPITLDALAIFITKLAAKERLPLSYSQIRRMMERSIEVSMDMKHAQGCDPLLFRKVINAEREMDLEARDELIEQGYVVEDIETLVACISKYGGSIRKLAKTNPAYNILIGGNDAVEQFLDTAPEDISKHFINSIFGSGLRKPGDRRYHQKIARSRERYGHVGFVATMDRRSGELHIECGMAECRVQTSDGGKAIRLSSTEIALFRPSVEVNFQIDGDGLRTSCALHHGWPSVINSIARSEFSWELWGIVSQPDAEVANRDLERLVQKILSRMYKSYQLDGAGSANWNTECSAERYVVLDTALPKIDGYDFIQLEMLRRQAAAETLVRRGLINNLSDTASGNPGMSFFAKSGNGTTVVTKTDPLNNLASLKRSSVRNALANLVDITGVESESYVADTMVTPPMVEMNVACLPINSMDAVLVSSAVKDKLTAKMPVVLPGCDFSSYEFYPLQDGSKIQGRLDLKGVCRVIPEEQMPWIRYADGTQVRAEIVMPLDSKGHEMLRHSHCTLALTAAANRLREISGGRMSVPKNVSVERIAKLVQRSGLYDSDDMTAEILRPGGEVIGCYPAGMAAIGVHRQIPEVMASIHGRETIADRCPTSIADGGVVSGLAGALCMKAEGLDLCLEELHSQINPELDAEICALRRCIVRG